MLYLLYDLKALIAISLVIGIFVGYVARRYGKDRS